MPTTPTSSNMGEGLQGFDACTLTCIALIAAGMVVAVVRLITGRDNKQT